MSDTKNRTPIQDGQKASYYPLAQNRASNLLQKQITVQITDESQFDLLGNGSIESEDFRLFIRGYKEKKDEKEIVNGVNQSAAMLLDSLMITATQDGLQSTLVKLPLKNYMSMRGLKDERETRLQVKRDINALERISFEYKGIGKQRNSWLKVSLSGGTSGIKNGDIIFRFNQDFFDSFRVSEKRKYIYMYFPREALQGNIRQHPYTYWLAREISEHKRMNLGKTNENIIGIATLIKACPNFPTHEGSGRAVSERIIKPFQRDMDELKPSLSWHFNDFEKIKDYKSFMAATITIHWNKYPDTEKLENGKAKRAKRQAAKKK